MHQIQNLSEIKRQFNNIIEIVTSKYLSTNALGTNLIKESIRKIYNIILSDYCFFDKIFTEDIMSSNCYTANFYKPRKPNYTFSDEPNSLSIKDYLIETEFLNISSLKLSTPIDNLKTNLDSLTFMEKIISEFLCIVAAKDHLCLSTLRNNSNYKYNTSRNSFNQIALDKFIESGVKQFIDNVPSYSSNTIHLIAPINMKEVISNLKFRLPVTIHYPLEEIKIINSTYNRRVWMPELFLISSGDSDRHLIRPIREFHDNNTIEVFINPTSIYEHYEFEFYTRTRENYVVLNTNKIFSIKLI